jgi:serine/threonine protein kinase
MALGPGTRIGSYEILSAIGAGGMGEVYLAHDTKLKRDVALKVLPDSVTGDADRLARFQREAEVLASLNHPHIGHIHGLEESDGIRALVLELVDGPTLADRIAHGPVPLHEALAIARQIADALDAAHEKGIVHRDLKPANIKIRPDGVVKVLDFGLARRADPAPARDLAASPTESVHGTRAGVILGTAAYMSPEQARGRPVDKRTDVWAYGCVLYEMLAGRRPFSGDTVSDLIAAILGSEPDWGALPPTCPPGVRRLLQRLLEKDLTRRMRDLGDVRFAIEDALAPGDVAASSPAPLARWSWRTVGLLGVLAVVAAVASLALLSQAPSTTMPAIGEAIVSQLTNYDGTETSASLSPDGRSFAFVSRHGGTADIWLRQVAGGEPVRLTNDGAVESALAFAPSGESIYFTRSEGADKAIWQIGALGGQARKVLNGADLPSPSPDGRRLAWFARPAGREYSYTLAVGGADGSGPRVMAEHVAAVVNASRASWSPDGRWLAYSDGGLFAPRNLFVVNVDSGQVRQVTKFTRSSEGVVTQAWLPDNRDLIVSFRAGRGVLAPTDLGVLNVETGSIARLTMNVADSFDAPSVSADGSRVIVTASRYLRELWKVPLGSDPDANGRAAVRLLDASQDPMWAYVSRDGRTLLFNNALVGSRNLWTMPLDASTKPRQITAVPGDAVMHSSLSPDGTHVAFVSSTTGNSDVWVQNVDGSDMRQLTNDSAAEAWPIWSPDGRLILYGSLRDGKWETRRVPAAGGPAEVIVEGFFRGDSIRMPDGSGTWAVTSSGTGGGLRLLDVERRRVVWQEYHGPGNAMPMFSQDGRLASMPYSDGSDRDAIWVYDVGTGKGRLAVRFDRPFQIAFRASWVDDDRAFVVNRQQPISHIVMFDRFWKPAN